MSLDLNLLTALEALLAERSVTGAARRLGLSPSATSRTLTRLRAVTGDGLLVQAGRSLVPTPHAEWLATRVPELMREARAVLGPTPGGLDLARLERRFSLRAGEGFVELLAAPVAARVAAAAPHVQLRFLPKPDWDAEPMRDGRVDLEIGVVKTAAPEVRTQLLFRDQLVGIARRGHPLLRAAAVTTEAYAACQHAVASRKGEDREPIDPILEARGLKRRVTLVLPNYPDAMRVIARSDLIGLVPRSCLGHALVPDHATALGLASFAPPVALPAFAIAALWHPRLEADPAHRWLRETVVRLCREAYP
ncbi:LysR family transcriptional regulator [Acidisoma sp. 7E03]